MPTITARQDAGRQTQTAQTETPWSRPRESVTASTKPPETFAEKFAKQSPEPGQASITADTQAVRPAASKAVTLSPQLTALARKEAKIRQQEQAFKAEKAAFEAKQTEANSLLQIKEKLAAKDFSALEALGVSYEDYANYVLNKPETEKPEFQAIKKVENDLQQMKAEQEARTAKQYEITLGQYRSEIKRLVDSNPAFSSIKELQAEEHVLQHIIDTVEEDNEVLSVEQASKEIEDFLVEDALAMSKLSKVRAQTTPTAPKKTLPPPTTRQPARTLTNTASPASTEKYTGKQMQHLTPKERIALALQKAQQGAAR